MLRRTLLNALKGRTAWVTGAASGIGYACAQRLAMAGTDLVLLDQNEAGLEALRESLASTKVKVQNVKIDLGDGEAIAREAEALLKISERIDCLVHCAGMSLEKRSFMEMAATDWDRLIQVNLSGAFFLAKAVLPTMRKQRYGSIVQIASMAGKQAFAVTGPAYTAAKHGLVGFAHSINAEEGKHGIRACAICPGEVNTPILDRRPVPVPAEARAQMIQPQDVAEAIFLACALPARTCMSEILLWPTNTRKTSAKEGRLKL